MIWTIILLFFVGTNAWFFGMYCGIASVRWERKPPLRAIALGGLVLSTASMVFLNGIPAVPVAGVGIFCAGVLVMLPVDNSPALSDAILELVGRLRAIVFGGQVLAIASMVFLNGLPAVLAAGVCGLCAGVLAIHLAWK